LKQFDEDMRKQKNLNNLSIEGMEAWQGYLSQEKREILIKSWAGTFRRHILPNLPIEELSKNYSKTMGRPTKDLLTGMGAAILQQMFDLTDEETREQLAFNQQWHFALETYNPAEQLFSEKTLWTIRHHLTKDEIGQSIFNEVTDKLAKTFKVDTSKQRMDSVHVYSNMARLGRVRLIAKTITKFLRNLKRHNPTQYTADISEELRHRYTKEEATEYFGSAKPSESQKRLQEVAIDLNWLIEKYFQDEAIMGMDSYKLMTRVLSEQCVIKEGKVEIKASKEISSDSIQNPSDIDAGYDGHKGQGYQVQLSETYSRKENESGNENIKETILDLITYVKVESADKHDSKALQPALGEMQSRGIKPEEMLADASYGGDDNVNQAKEQEVEIISPVVGKKSEKDYTDFEFDEQSKEVKQCPNGKFPQSVKRNKKCTITARWLKEDCMNCSLKENCQTKNGPRGRRMIYSEKEIRLWQRRQYEGSAEFKDKYRYRAGIEGTNSRYIHMTGARRVRYRGQENVGFSETIKALGINMFRVCEYIKDLDNFIDSIANIAIKNVILLIFIYVREKIRIICEKYSVNSNFRNIIPIMV
jgi:hypothetical protein